MSKSQIQPVPIYLGALFKKWAILAPTEVGGGWTEEGYRRNNRNSSRACWLSNWAMVYIWYRE